MKNCNEIQQLIAELEFSPIEDKTLLKHLETCKECQAYKIACDEMNQAMSQWSDFDADDGLVESTLSSIINLQDEETKPKKLLNTQWASALAASFMLVSLIALFPYNSISNFGLSSVSSLKQNDRIEQQKIEEPKVDDNVQFSAVKKPNRLEEEKRAIAKRKEALHRKKEVNKSDFEFYDVEVAEEVIRKQRRMPKKSPTLSSLPTEPMVGAMAVSGAISSEKSTIDYRKEIEQGFKDVITNQPKLEALKPTYNRVEENKPQSMGNEMSESVAEYEHEYDQDKVMLDRVVTTGSRIRASDLEKAAPVMSISREDSIVLPEDSSITSVGKLSKTKEKQNLKSATRHLRENAAIDEGLGNKIETPKGSSVKSPIVELDGKSESQIKVYQYNADPYTIEGNLFANDNAQLSPANKYLAEMNSLNNISYQTASGYWANTYLPGDSSMRLLEARLSDNNTLTLINSIKQNIQPFDYPDNSALAVYLNSDVANVQSQQPTRMRIQVGIQASNRQGGQRSAMNIALVFDMNNRTPEYAAKLKALLLALLKAKQPGDHISLTVAGAAGGVLIESKDFRHGQIQVVMNNLFSDEKQINKGLSLSQAIQLASKKLENNDDPSATLGSSVMILLSATAINNMPMIESMVHANALKGITTSTISLGLDNHQQLKQLSLAGQGHARILQSSNDARRVIDAELLASSRAVARALRLRIRLAKGVKLVEVIDSYNLNEKQSQRVRNAELSLDKRLSENLGIKTDRGEDEEGIQIVIPSFFAGDTHVILLDVVAGNNNATNAIADVTLRYKDLLYLRNAISRKQLSLGNNPKTLGPLQLNVMKNTLASKFSKSIKQASNHIRKGNHSQALALLLNMQQLYQSLRQQFPVWNKDKEILNDEKLLQEYIKILNSISINDVQKVNYIVDSMQYISWRKQITQTQ